jgi:hypothetical protein
LTVALDNITRLRPPAHTGMSVPMALESAKLADLQDVLIVGYDQEGNLIVRSSAMSRRDALWLAVKAQQHALGDLG